MYVSLSGSVSSLVASMFRELHYSPWLLGASAQPISRSIHVNKELDKQEPVFQRRLPTVRDDP